MRIHTVNGASFHPSFGAPAQHRDGRGYLCSRCLIIEVDERVVLVDAGFGTDDIEDPVGRMGRAFLALARPRLDASETIVARLAALGIDRADVTDILVTHLDLDHAGGMPDFPGARVHVHEKELDVALEGSRFTHGLRYVGAHWQHAPEWVRFGFDGETWRGFPVHEPIGLPPSIRVISLPGHTNGHCGVLIEHDGGWLLHAGDSFMEVREIVTPGHRPSFATKAHHFVFDDAPAVARATREMLRRLVRESGDDLTLINTHDPHVRTPDGDVRLGDGVDALGAEEGTTAT